MPVKSAIDGKDVIVIDDSIVRGISSKAIVKTLRPSGQKVLKFLLLILQFVILVVRELIFQHMKN
ncbi:MAG: hypothetical protein Ct9H300mP24_8800 [Candidatus Neomarinimicrobiota bacterium]|nr:MAG: hypothetical protein Ct9H300mP24_8800 [Candidatus Neomarinimicrobiota bacterium]